MVRAFPSQIAETPHNSLNRTALAKVLSSLYADSPWLTVTGMLMLADILLSLIGLIVDPTVITAAPAWMKPLKFGISTSLFSFTVAWMIGRLSRTRRFALIISRPLSVALILEIVLIDMQAARHTTSHFNFTTSFDAAVFGIMGMGIGVVSLATTLLLVAACLERFPNHAQGLAIRLGLLIALASMGVGGLMTLPTPEQLAAMQASGHATAHIGAHTVGAADGGPSMPVTGWSADHGDLRIAHFLGLHAMQVLLLVLWLARNRVIRMQTRLVLAAAACTGIAFAEVLWQALRGQPLLRPDSLTLTAWSIWAAATLAFVIWAIYRGSDELHRKGVPS
jgi:hypothetical protein